MPVPGGTISSIWSGDIAGKATSTPREKIVELLDGAGTEQRARVTTVGTCIWPVEAPESTARSRRCRWQSASKIGGEEPSVCQEPRAAPGGLVDARRDLFRLGRRYRGPSPR
jgi:hypothetical protein